VNAAAAYGTKGVAAATNVPGSRRASVSWVDENGSLWVFGGTGLIDDGSSGELNDLWRFDP
jgi:N-acetylneuraminic acid mutarotase